MRKSKPDTIVHVTDGYRLVIDKYNFNLEESYEGKESGSVLWRVLGHHSTLASALNQAAAEVPKNGDTLDICSYIKRAEAIKDELVERFIKWTPKKVDEVIEDEKKRYPMLVKDTGVPDTSIIGPGIVELRET